MDIDVKRSVRQEETKHYFNESAIFPFQLMKNEKRRRKVSKKMHTCPRHSSAYAVLATLTSNKYDVDANSIFP